MTDFWKGLWNFWYDLWVNARTFFSVPGKVACYLSILVMVVSIFIKTTVNKKVTFLDVKQCIIEIPFEVLVLCLGGAVSNIGSSKKNEDIISLFFILLFLIIDAAVINWTNDRLAYFNGKISGFVIAATYFLAFIGAISVWK